MNEDKLGEVLKIMHIITSGVCPECGNVFKREPNGLLYCSNWIECKWQMKPPEHTVA